MIDRMNLAGSFTLPGTPMNLNRMGYGAMQARKVGTLDDDSRQIPPGGDEGWFAQEPGSLLWTA